VKIVITAVIACALTLGGVFGVLAWRGGASKPEPPKSVRIESPSRGDLVETVSASGGVEPKTKVSLSAKVSARIIELPFKEGQVVTKGDANATPPVPASVLVRLDDKDLQADLRSAEARRSAQAAMIEVAKARLVTQQAMIQGARSLLEDANRSLAREAELLRNQISSQEAVDRAECQVEKLQADLLGAQSSLLADEMNLGVLQHNLTSADADVNRSKDNLAYTVITSPIDGVVTRLKAQVGEMAITGTMNNPGTEILQVADLSRMLVVAEIDEASIGEVRVAQSAKVRMQAYGDRVFEGTVDSIALVHSNSLYSRSKYFETRVLLKTDGQRIYSGLTADVDIETRRHSGVLKVPSQAVLPRKVDDLPAAIRDGNPNVMAAKNETPVVYRVVGDAAVVTPVKIGPADATHTVILAGLSDLDKVVVGPYKALEQMKHDQPVCDERKGGASSRPASAPAEATAEATSASSTASDPATTAPATSATTTSATTTTRTPETATVKR
jgi:HlyD family secretion protein